MDGASSGPAPTTDGLDGKVSTCKQRTHLLHLPCYYYFIFVAPDSRIHASTCQLGVPSIHLPTSYQALDL